jgi:DNA-binding NarL/FixJ family response regulator
MLHEVNTSPLKDLSILVIDEPDILDTITEILDMCIIHQTSDHETALQYLLGYKYDFVILDVNLLNGLELLKISVSQGFPTVVFTAHELTLDILKKSIQLGAIFFFPKERMSELKEFLEKNVIYNWKSNCLSLLDRLSMYFNKHFGQDWREKDKFFMERQKSIAEIKKQQGPFKLN